jgi:hypothetical protein
LLLGLHFYLRFLGARDADPGAARGFFTTFWLCSLLAFLTHPVALVYFAALCVHVGLVWWRLPVLWRRPGFLIVLALVWAGLAGGWYGWLLWRFGAARTSSSSPTAMMATQWRWWLASLGHNAATSLVPAELREPYARVHDDAVAVHAGQPGFAEALYRGVTAVYFSTLTGALTLSLSAYLLVRAAKQVSSWVFGTKRANAGAGMPPGQQDETSALWTFAILGCLGAMLLHPGFSAHGLAHNAFFPSVLVWLGLAWGMLACSGGSSGALVIFGMAAEFLAMFWSHVWAVLRDPSLLDPWDVNAAAKAGDHMVFTADVLAPWQPAVVVLALLVQVTLVALLWSTWRGKGVQKG